MPRGLTVIVTQPDGIRAGLELAAANAALGGRARLFAQGETVAALALPLDHFRDEAHAAAGLPTLAQLFEETFALGVDIIVCQSGLALAGLPADTLDPRVTFAGPVAVLRSLDDDRLAVL